MSVFEKAIQLIVTSYNLDLILLLSSTIQIKVMPLLLNILIQLIVTPHILGKVQGLIKEVCRLIEPCLLIGTREYFQKLPKRSVLSFQQRYGSNPSALYSVVKNCLVKEAALVRNAEMTASGGGGHCVSAVATEIMMEIDRHLGQLKAKTQDCDGNITKTRQDQESHSINYYKHHQLSGPFQ